GDGGTPCERAKKRPVTQDLTPLCFLEPGKAGCAHQPEFWLYFAVASAITPPFRRPAEKGCRGDGDQHAQTSNIRPAGPCLPPQRRAKCPSSRPNPAPRSASR